MRTPALLFILSLLAFSCTWKKTVEVADEIKDLLDADKVNSEVEQKFEAKKFTGEKKYYYESGALKTIIRYKNGKREGMAANYYENGGVCVETEYKQGKKDGRYTWYFESGKPYRIITYKADKKHGPYKEYYHGGKLKLEATFTNDMPCKGAVEYDMRGNAKEPIKIIAANGGYDKKRSIYTIRLRFSEQVKNARFFIGKLTDGDCFDINKMEGPIYVKNNEGLIEIPAQPGHQLQGEADIVGVASSPSGLEVVTTKKHTINVLVK